MNFGPPLHLTPNPEGGFMIWRTRKPHSEKRWGFLFQEGKMDDYLTPLICLLLLVFPSPTRAETKTFIEEYTYQASEADSKLSSRAIAPHREGKIWPGSCQLEDKLANLKREG